jgi:pimeloyl-ACP methyl ester carboxylesterase
LFERTVLHSAKGRLPLSPTHSIIDGMQLVPHVFEAPLDYDNGNSPSIKIFAREVVCIEKKDNKNLPWLVFLQGGPGFGAPRPTTKSGWLARALKDFRVLLVDQRGTTSAGTYIQLQTLKDMSPEEQAEYLTFFRADSIVKDCETMRAALGVERWTLLGQSFGGFCAFTYLSIAPESLERVLITGGIPPLTYTIDDVYRATYSLCAGKNETYYKRYPQDRELVSHLVNHLRVKKVVLPNGDPLTAEKFLSLGIRFGYSSGFDEVHYLLESAFLKSGETDELSYEFLKAMQMAFEFDSNPIYALLHEAIYLERSSSNWAAQRMLSEHKSFSAESYPVFFTGEMIYPWYYKQVCQLAPLEKAAHILAQKSDWKPLYDLEQLKGNKVPIAAVIYENDMYVSRVFSDNVAASIPHIKLWHTSEYEHCGLRTNGEVILDRLLNMSID